MGFEFTFQYVNARDCLGIGIALPLVCILIVALRFWVRYKQKIRVGIDDWLIVGGLLWIIAMGICFIYGAAKKVMGYPAPEIPPELASDENYVTPSYKLLEVIEFPFQIFMMLAYGCIKMSVVAFYRRIFVVVKGQMFDYITKVTQVVIFLWALSFLLLIIFPCGVHVDASWGSTASQVQYCPVAFTSEYGLTISDLILDVIIFTMPLPMIWTLQLSIKKKLAVSGILLLAASAVGAGIARLVLYVQGLKAITALAPLDENQILTVSLYWSLLESGLSLLAACLPTLSYLFRIMNIETALRSVRSVFSLGSNMNNSSRWGSRSATDSRTQPPPVVYGDSSYVKFSEGSSKASFKLEVGERDIDMERDGSRASHGSSHAMVDI